MARRLIASLAGGVLLLSAQAHAQAPAPLPPPVIANPSYTSVVLELPVDRPAAAVWARVGKYCDIAEWFRNSCVIVSGAEDRLGAVRRLNNGILEMMVAKTDLSYTYTQPVRVGAPYNAYHGTLEVKPVTATTSRLVYSFLYDNSMLADDAARAAEIANRRARFGQGMANMKILAEGGTLPPAPAPAATAAPAAPLPPPAIANPTYTTLVLEQYVKRPAAAVWARVGKFCDVSEWLFNSCKIISGAPNELGAVRQLGNGIVEILVGKTDLSYTYAQPVRAGVPYNAYNATLQVRPLTPTTSRLIYSFFYDTSMLADDAARASAAEGRRARFSLALTNMKILAEGGTRLTPPPPLR